MILTNRIISGFDVELQLGAGWFLTAFQALNQKGRLLPNGPPPPFPPDAEVTVDDVQIVFNVPDRDLQATVTIGGIQLTILITLELSSDGAELVIISTIPNSDPISIPFDALSGLAGPPIKLKVQGDGDHAPVIVFLANLDLRASPQSDEPLPLDQHIGRGTPLAVSFLPLGKDIAIGLGVATFPRIANDIWHTNLRADDGSHPFPDSEKKQGKWKSVSAAPQSGRIRIKMKAKVPIKIWPDADINIKIDLSPEINNGRVCFSLEVDADVDTGLLGDLFAFIAGGLLGFIVGLLFGGAFIGAGIGAFGGVIVLEIGEAVKNGEVKRKVIASLEGENIPPVLICDQDVVVEATAQEDDGNLVGSFVNAIPRSIPVGTDNPDPLHERTVLVEAVYDDFQMDSSGMAFAGNVQPSERFQPLPATLIDRRRNDDELQSLIYRAEDGTEVELPLEEVLQRMEEAELKAPYKLQTPPTDVDIRIPEGRLPSVCLSADAIRRRETIIREIHFTTGLDLKTEETIAMQDAGALIIWGLQLIHPKDYNPYYRASADDSTDNNFESLPPF